MQVATLSHSGGPEAFVLSDVPRPVPGPQEILIRVAAAGVNRADVWQREGRYPAPADAPAWPGLEVSGWVVGHGDAVQRFSHGDQVCALVSGGGYGEYICVHESLALATPPHLDVITAGALMETACTVWSNLREAGATAGHTVLVHGGSGAVGTTAIQMATALGMRVIATAGSAERARRCEDLGAQIGIDYAHEDFEEIVRAAGGADVIVDVVGAAYLERNLRALAPDGALVVIGLHKGAVASLDLRLLLSKRARVIGTTLRSRPLPQRIEIVEGVHRDVWPLIPERFTPVIHASYPLDQVVAAHREMDSGSVFGSLVLTTGATA